MIICLFVYSTCIYVYLQTAGLIRLVQGTNTSGIIQIHNGTNWLYICPDRWSYRDADIACKQLGFNVVRDVSQTSVVSGDVVYYGSQFDCYGTESELIECYHIKTDICDEVGVATLACEDRELFLIIFMLLLLLLLLLLLEIIY